MTRAGREVGGDVYAILGANLQAAFDCPLLVEAGAEQGKGMARMPAELGESAVQRFQVPPDELLVSPRWRHRPNCPRAALRPRTLIRSAEISASIPGSKDTGAVGTEASRRGQE